MVRAGRRAILLGGLLSLASTAGRGQQSSPTLIGLLGSGSAEPYAPGVAAFRRGLGETGYVDGRNVTIDARWAEGRNDRLPALAAELVRRRAAVIVAFGGNAPAQAAKAATTQIPIVFLSGGEPVKDGLVDSLSHPGGNATGVSWLSTALMPKRLELLHQLAPKADLIGVLVNPTYPDSDLQVQELKQAAGTIRQRIEVATASTEREIETAFATLHDAGAGALLVANDPYFYSLRAPFVALAARHRLPTFYFEREFVAAGGLASYGASLAEVFRQGGIYAGRVLHGAKPADLPVLQPTTIELVINLTTAKTLGIEVPPALLVAADEAME